MRDEDNRRRVLNEVRQWPTIGYAVRTLSFLAILWHLSLAQEEKRLLGVS
jgi:hypothetical protein